MKYIQLFITMFVFSLFMPSVLRADDHIASELNKGEMDAIGERFDDTLEAVDQALLDTVRDLSFPDERTQPPYFRGGAAGTLLILEARQVMDEMLENDMRDEFLTNTVSWSALEESAIRAMEWIRVCHKAEFDEIAESFQEHKNRLGERKMELIRVHERINADLVQIETRFFEAQGRERGGAWGRMGRESQQELATTGTEKGLSAIADDLQRLGRSRVAQNTRYLGTSVSILFTIKSAIDLGRVSLEAFEMDMLVPEMLELMELEAYLAALVTQYEDLEIAYDDLYRDLVASFSAHDCRQCTRAGDILIPPECSQPEAEEDDEPDELITDFSRGLRDGQEWTTVRGEKRLMDSNGRTLAIIKNNKTTIIHESGGTQDLPMAADAQQINQMLDIRR